MEGNVTGPFRDIFYKWAHEYGSQKQFAVGVQIIFTKYNNIVTTR
jgi:hypothetical protein